MILKQIFKIYRQLGRTLSWFLCEMLFCVGRVLGAVQCELCYKWFLVKLLLRTVSPMLMHMEHET